VFVTVGHLQLCLRLALDKFLMGIFLPQNIFKEKPNFFLQNDFELRAPDDVNLIR